MGDRKGESLLWERTATEGANSLVLDSQRPGLGISTIFTSCMWLWASYSTSLRLRFIIYKMEQVALAGVAQ